MGVFDKDTKSQEPERVTFELVIKDQAELTDELATRVSGALSKGDVVTFSGPEDGAIKVKIERQADSMIDAITSALDQLRNAGFAVQPVQLAAPPI